MAAWSEGGFSLPTQRWCAGDGPRLLRWANKAGRCVTTALEIAPFSRSGDPRLCRARSPAGCLQDHMCTNSTGEQWQGCLTGMPSNASACGAVRRAMAAARGDYLRRTTRPGAHRFLAIFTFWRGTPLTAAQKSEHVARAHSGDRASAQRRLSDEKRRPRGGAAARSRRRWQLAATKTRRRSGFTLPNYRAPAMSRCRR